jgi:choline dehydrogenase
VHIRSASPHEAPAIRLNYLSVETDRQATVAALREIRRIVHSEPLREFVAEEVEPGPALQTDEELLEYCRERATSIYHPACSAHMGADASAVVDERLRVRGLGGLRVVDGSIMPSLVSGNSNAAIIAIAEKAADLILRDAMA